MVVDAFLVLVVELVIVVPIEMSSDYSPTLYQEEKLKGLRRDNGARNLTRLRPIHYQILRMHLSGMNNEEIARQVGKTSSTISRILTDPLVLSLLDNHYKAEDARFKALYPKVIDAIDDALDKNNNPKLRLEAADRYLRAHQKFDKASQLEKKEEETAEDVIARMLAAVQVNMHGEGNTQININIGGEKVNEDS